ncbi:MAG: TIM barrel protein [bacterium]
MRASYYLTGFADEAARDLDGQLRATRELGWTNIESRNLGGINLHDLSDAAFDVVCGKLADAGVRINCFGSAIANWNKQIDQPFESSLAATRRAIPRMQRLGTKLVRIMSFAVRQDAAGADRPDQMEEERFRRVRELYRMFTDAGLVPVHENCRNYGGLSWQHTLRLLDNVPGLKLVFDTGNPVLTDDRSRPPPRPKQSSWEFYEHVREQVVYVHLKDGRWDAAANRPVFTHLGDGDGDVRRILADLLRRGYAGGISIEPHLAVVYHDSTRQCEDAIRYANYVEYGRRLMRLLAEIETGS